MLFAASEWWMRLKCYCRIGISCNYRIHSGDRSESTPQIIETGLLCLYRQWVWVCLTICLCLALPDAKVNNQSETTKCAMESGDGNTGEWPPAFLFIFLLLPCLSCNQDVLSLTSLFNRFQIHIQNEHFWKCSLLSTFCIIDSFKKKKDMAAFQNPCEQSSLSNEVFASQSSFPHLCLLNITVICSVSVLQWFCDKLLNSEWTLNRFGAQLHILIV